MYGSQILDQRSKHAAQGWTIDWWRFLGALVVVGSSLLSITVYSLLLF